MSTVLNSRRSLTAIGGTSSAMGEGNRHSTWSGCDPRLQRLPSRQIDLIAMGLLSERPKYRCRLFTGVCDYQAKHPGFVLGVKA
jgi:hypothetical protein